MNDIPEWATAKQSGRGRPGKYKLKEMALYEVKSFSPEMHGGQTVDIFRRYLYQQGRWHGMEFKARQLEDGTIEVCRIK